MTELRKSRFFARIAIDREAGAARLRYITDVPGQQAVYQAKAAEARAYLAAVAAEAALPSTPHLTAEAAATGSTVAVLAGVVAATADLWLGTRSPSIEAARMAGKAAVSAAQDSAAVAAAKDAALAALMSL